VRVVFHDEDEAEAVAARLRSDGFQAGVVREWFAGEDDDEDHPWAVVTDAPSFAVELYAEEFDAWVDEGAPAHPQPLELPDAPRRVKGHFTDERRSTD
jgi:hypothetical protein